MAITLERLVNNRVLVASDELAYHRPGAIVSALFSAAYDKWWLTADSIFVVKGDKTVTVNQDYEILGIPTHNIAKVKPRYMMALKFMAQIQPQKELPPWLEIFRRTPVYYRPCWWEELQQQIAENLLIHQGKTPWTDPKVYLP